MIKMLRSCILELFNFVTEWTLGVYVIDESVHLYGLTFMLINGVTYGFTYGVTLVFVLFSELFNSWSSFKTMIRIERKEFSVQWSGVQGRSLVVITERSKKRTVHGFLMKECATWLSPALRKFASEGEINSQVEGAGKDAKRW